MVDRGYKQGFVDIEEVRDTLTINLLVDSQRGLVVFHSPPQIKNPPGARACRNRRRSVAGVVNDTIQRNIATVNKFFPDNIISSSIVS
jgi:hypothetical protein